MLTNEEIEELTERLLERRVALLEAATGTVDGAAVVELDQARMGRLSRMDALQSQALSQEIRRRNEREVATIDAALKRLDEHTYGLCLRCEEEIRLARLRANPGATLCIDCANRAEKRLE